MVHDFLRSYEKYANPFRGLLDVLLLDQEEIASHAVAVLALLK